MGQWLQKKKCVSKMKKERLRHFSSYRVYYLIRSFTKCFTKAHFHPCLDFSIISAILEYWGPFFILSPKNGVVRTAKNIASDRTAGAKVTSLPKKSPWAIKLCIEIPLSEILLRLDKERNFGGSPCSLLYSWSLDAHLKQNKWFPLRL